MVRQSSRIIFALFAMTGRVTMLGLSRWTGAGGSYRTIQCWFYAIIPWAQVFICLFRQHLFQVHATYILAGDEVVVTKAGKHTYLISKLRSDSALYFPYTGLQAKRGTRRQYGDRVNDRNLPGAVFETDVRSRWHRDAHLSSHVVASRVLSATGPARALRYSSSRIRQASVS